MRDILGTEAVGYYSEEHLMAPGAGEGEPLASGYTEYTSAHTPGGKSTLKARKGFLFCSELTPHNSTFHLFFWRLIHSIPGPKATSL